MISSLSAPKRCAVRTARIAPARANAAAASEFTASPASRSSAATPLRLQEDLRNALEHTPGKIDHIERACFVGLKSGDNVAGGQRSACEPGKSVRGQQKEPGREHEWKRESTAPWLHDVGGPEHDDDRDGRPQHHIHPHQRARRQKCRQRKSDKDAVVTIEPGVKRLFVDAQPLRRQGCIRRPRAGRQSPRAAHRLRTTPNRSRPGKVPRSAGCSETSPALRRAD